MRRIPKSCHGVACPMLRASCRSAAAGCASKDKNKGARGASHNPPLVNEQQEKKTGEEIVEPQTAWNFMNLVGLWGNPGTGMVAFGGLPPQDRQRLASLRPQGRGSHCQYRHWSDVPGTRVTQRQYPAAQLARLMRAASTPYVTSYEDEALLCLVD